MLNKPGTRFVLAQIFAISIWVLISVVQWTNNPKASPGLKIPLIVRTTEAITIFFVSGIFIVVLEFIGNRFKKFRLWLSLIPAIYAGALISNIISIQLRYVINYAPPRIDNFFFIQSLHFYIPILLVLVFYAITKTQIEVRKEREEKLIAESNAREAKWIMLRYQVNPHFLFNALNSVRALIGHNDEKARKAITEMSEYFRYSLSTEKKSMVAVIDEMKAVENYLEIQKIRFQNKLRITKIISPESERCKIPIFTIQTLVENAVKYGLKTADGKLEIIIESYFSKNSLHILVKNTGKLVHHEGNKHSEKGSQTGIQNLKSRLKYLDRNYEFNLNEHENMVVAEINLRCQNES